MPTISEIRRKNLRAVIDADFDGVPARLAKAVGCQQTTITRLYSSAESARNMGDRLARRIELATGRDSGWMDAIHDDGIDPLAAALHDLTPTERQAALAFLDALKARR